MSCRFAGCNNPGSFWNTIMSQRIELTNISYDNDIPFGQSNIFKRSYPKKIGQLGDLYACVPSMQNFPRQLDAGENQDLYFATQLAIDALNDAGIHHGPNERINGTVRFGYAPPFNASTMNWLQHTAFLEQTMEILHAFLPNAPEEALEATKAKLRESLPEPNVSSFLMGSGYRFVSWIARECSFCGAATIMDAGLLTGAAVIMNAIEDLRSGVADVALAGVQEPPLNRSYLEGLSGEIKFSTESELHPFEQNQNGTIPGEGCTFFVLKRRDDALKDHDRIYALIKNVEIGHNPDDDPSVILHNAIKNAEVPVDTISLIEADGSGIAEMEAREIESINRIWGEHVPGKNLVGVGSVKGNIGNTLRVSMAAGVMKASLALRNRVLPPQIPPFHPNEAIANISSSAYLLTEARPWITGNSATPRRAAVIGTNFDMSESKGGRAAAIILEEEPEER